MPDFHAGDRVGPYVILGLAGCGGMAEVYKAEQPQLKRHVALKVIPTRLRDESLAGLFARELEISGRLSHPGIARAYDAGESDGRPYLVCEFIDGQTLSELVAKGGALSSVAAVDYTLQAARALQYIHAHGIVHRDVKPGNLMLDRAETVRFVDMGLALEAGPDDLLAFDNARLDCDWDGQEIVVRSGAPDLDQCASAFCELRSLSPPTDEHLSALTLLVGTAMYMSPEQTLSPRVDRRADIYSLGCTLYYLLAGKSIVTHGTDAAGPTLQEILLAHRRGRLPSLKDSVPDVPPALEAIFRRMVARLPQDRYQSAAELIPDLEAVVNSLRQARAVFLSYRRDDAMDATFRLFENLSDRLGANAVFMDIDGIPLGADFKRYLDDAVGGCRVFLAVIGDHWASATDGRGKRRLDMQGDFVRLEIRAALDLGKPVIPILVGRAKMPEEDALPADIRGLAYRQAAELRAGPSYREQMNRLVSVLQQILEGRK